VANHANFNIATDTPVCFCDLHSLRQWGSTETTKVRYLNRHQAGSGPFRLTPFGKQ
jgi:hypothetical protein